MEIPRNKPEGTSSAEWVALNMDFREPNVSHSEFIAELKLIVVEVSAWRLQHPEARLRLREWLKKSGYSAEEGFPGDPAGTMWPVKAGGMDDLLSFERLDWTLNHQFSVIHGGRDRYDGLSGSNLKEYPAWMLVKFGESGPEDWRERWNQLGGVFYTPLIQGRNPDTEETGMIALKDEPIWGKLGDSGIFPDGIDRNHPPFYLNSGLQWKPVDRWELEHLGILPRAYDPSTLSPEKRRLYDKLQARSLIRKRRYYDRLDRALGKNP